MSHDEAFWKTITDVDEAVSIHDGPAQFLDDFAAVPRTAGHLFASHWCQAEVSNGGFRQFYGNSTGVLAPEAVEAFKEIGMPAIAAVVNEANAWFGYVYPRQRQARELALKTHETMDPGSSNPFEKLEDEFFRLLRSENSGFEAAAKIYWAGQDGA